MTEQSWTGRDLEGRGGSLIEALPEICLVLRKIINNLSQDSRCLAEIQIKPVTSGTKF
jgi:hypothetical protein